MKTGNELKQDFLQDPVTQLVIETVVTTVHELGTDLFNKHRHGLLLYAPLSTAIAEELERRAVIALRVYDKAQAQRKAKEAQAGMQAKDAIDKARAS